MAGKRELTTITTKYITNGSSSGCAFKGTFQKK